MKKVINTLLLDDEQGCLDNLEHYLGKHCPRIKIVATASTAEQVQQHFNATTIDLAFLDVHLFNQNIFDAIPDMANLPAAKIFVTAYKQYALNAIRTSALDYLLKPLETAEIQRCYHKITSYFDASFNHFQPVESVAAANSVTIRQGDHIFQVLHEEIIVLKAKGFYTEVYFQDNGKVRHALISKPINLLCCQWKKIGLQRVHRSYAINPQKIKAIKKHGANLCVELEDISPVPVAKRRASAFLEQYRH